MSLQGQDSDISIVISIRLPAHLSANWLAVELFWWEGDQRNMANQRDLQDYCTVVQYEYEYYRTAL